jgi:hypothetical protein
VKTEQKKTGTLSFCSQQSDENKHTQQLHTGGRENSHAALKSWMLVDEQSLEMVNKWTLHDNIHKLE